MFTFVEDITYWLMLILCPMDYNWGQSILNLSLMLWVLVIIAKILYGDKLIVETSL